MFGTVAHIRPKAGQEEQFIAMMRQWETERQPQVEGARAAYLYKCEQHPGEYIMVAVFDDRESYFKNANDPAQDQWYRRLRELLESDPTWEDGEIVYGGSTS
jgi:quinol monooxygenase YgiN